MHKNMRIYHRYLGFFLAGIMAVYAISGIVMIFRNTDYLKKDITETRQVPVGTEPEELGEILRIRDFKVDKTESGVVYFAQGNYILETGQVTYTRKDLPLLLKKMTQLHKANTDKPLFFLNILFGLSLLFFVVSSFWMFLPNSHLFKKGLYFTLAGLMLALLLVFV